MPNSTPDQYTVIRGTRAITVFHEPGYSLVYTQPINAATGKPWQARRIVATCRGEKHKTQAMACWLKTVNKFAQEVK